MTTINNDVNTRFNVSAQIDSRFARLDDTLRDLDRSLVGIDKRFNKITRGAQQTNRQMGALNSVMSKVNLGVKAFIAFELSRIFSDLVFGIGATISEAQTLEAQLVSLTGTSAKAERTFAALSELSLDLPVTGAGEVVTAFAKLENLNLDSSAKSIRELADLSAGLGRTVPDLVEAIADASTFEFERLKEQFGIVARSIGDEIQLTFRGTTVNIERSAAAIQDFLGDIARNEFAGAAERRLDTIGGAFGRFTNVLQQSILNLDEITGASRVAAAGINALSQSLDDLQGLSGPEALERRLDNQNKLLAEQQQILADLIALGTPEGIPGYTATPLEDSRNRIRGITDERDALLELYKDALRGRNELENARAPGELFASSFNSEVTALEKLIGKSKEALSPIERVNAALLEITETASVQDLGSEKVQQLIDDLIRLRGEAETNAARLAFKELQREAESFAGSFGTAMQRATRAYNEALSQLDSQGFLREIQRILGLDESAIRDALRNDFLDTLESSIGPPVIEGVTQRSIAAVREQKKLLDQALLNAAGDPTLQRALQDRYNNALLQESQLRIDDLSRRARTAVDPLFEFEQQYIANRKLFLTEIGGVTAGTAEQLSQLQNVLTEDFLSGFSNDALRNADNFREKFTAINAVLADLEGRGVVVGAELRQLFTNLQLESLIDDASFRDLQRIIREATGDTQDSAFEAQQQQRNDVIFSSTQDLYQRIAKLRADDLALVATSDRQRITLAQKAASDIFGVWAENSRTLFELNKILDISILATDAAVAVGKALSSSSPLGLFGNIISVGSVIARFAKLVNDVRNKEFGDSNIAGSGSNNTSFYRQAVLQGAGTNSAPINFNIYGNVLDTNGAFKREVVDTVKDAFGRDELTERDIVTRRF